MGTIELFDHTADVGLIVRGHDLDDLFRTAASAVFGYVVDNLDEVRVDRVESVAMTAESTADLFFSWLNDLIFRSETEHVLYCRFDVKVAADGLSMTGEIGGEAIDRARHVLDHEVKAVTRHAFAVERDGDDWVAELILDI